MTLRLGRLPRIAGCDNCKPRPSSGTDRNAQIRSRAEGEVPRGKRRGIPHLPAVVVYFRLPPTHLCRTKEIPAELKECKSTSTEQQPFIQWRICKVMYRLSNRIEPRRKLAAKYLVLFAKGRRLSFVHHKRCLRPPGCQLQDVGCLPTIIDAGENRGRAGSTLWGGVFSRRFGNLGQSIALQAEPAGFKTSVRASVIFAAAGAIALAYEGLLSQPDI